MSTDTVYMIQQVLEKLVGSKIVNVCSDSEGYFGLVVEDADGMQKAVFVNCDAEANAPGWLDIRDAVPDSVTLGRLPDLERYVRETPPELRVIWPFAHFFSPR